MPIVPNVDPSTSETGKKEKLNDNTFVEISFVICGFFKVLVYTYPYVPLASIGTRPSLPRLEHIEKQIKKSLLTAVVPKKGGVDSHPNLRW